MPTVTVDLADSSHSFYASYTFRSNANGTNFNVVDPPSGSSRALPATHWSTDNRDCFAFIFIVNIPRGATINSARMRFRVNNGVAAGTSGSPSALSRAYLAVENNLDVLGVGAVANGSLGRQPWQRLGRQTDAVNLFGARCGPVHTGDLATTGVTVRNPNALIYRPFMPDADQGNAGAHAPAIANGSWNETCNFAGALQALVNDPDWSGTNQAVLLWFFGDQNGDGNTVTDFNIGSLTTRTWASGTVGGTTGYANTAGQMYVNVGAGTPQLLLDFTSASIASTNRSSVSSGATRTRPSVCVARWHGVRVEAEQNRFVPKVTAGVRDLPPTAMSAANPFTATWPNPIATRTKVTNLIRHGRTEGNIIQNEDVVNASWSLEWDLNYWSDVYTGPLNTYSARFYFDTELESPVGYNLPVVEFYDGTTLRYGLYLRGYSGSTGNQLMLINGSGTTLDFTSFRLLPRGYVNGKKQMYRIELQASSDRTPSFTARVYLDDDLTPSGSVSGAVTTTANRMVFRKPANLVILHRWLADIEVYTDWDFRRTFPHSPYVEQKIEWFEYTSDGIEPLVDLGTISSIDSNGANPVFTTPNDALADESYFGEVWYGSTPPWTTIADLQYGNWSTLSLNLYIPNGTAPTDGWPIIVWAHGGFWSSGWRGQIPTQFVAQAVTRGFAVASVGYILCVQQLNTYPTYPTAGRYPTMILNFKEAARWLQDRARVTGNGTYPIDGTRMIASGHSAGGYNAVAAAVTRNLTDDGAGRNLTLSGNTSTFSTANRPDPVFAAAYGFAFPVNLAALRDQDPSHPTYPLLDDPSIGGVFRASCRMFMGRPINGASTDVSNTGIDEFIPLNTANIPHVGLQYGTTDLLVPFSVDAPFYAPYNQETILTNVWTANESSINATLSIHRVDDGLHAGLEGRDIDYDRFYKWVKTVL